MDYEIFNKRVQENIETLKEDMRLDRSIRASDFHFFEKARNEENDLFEFVNSFDIIAATAVGDLPSCNPTGEDGYRLINGEYIEMEYKISRRKKSLIWQTPRGSLKIGKANIDNQWTSLRSCFCASFVIKHNLASKNRLTILLVYDATFKQFISGFELDGDAIIKYLSNGSSTIMLSKFCNFGKEIELVVPSYRGIYEEWEEHVKETAPVVYKGDYFVSN